MTKLIVIVAVLAMAAAACGGSESTESDELGLTTEATEQGPALLNEEPAASSAPPASDNGNESAAPDTTSGDGNELELVPVSPAEEEEKAMSPPPTTSGGDESDRPEVDHPNPLVATAISDLVSRLGVDASSVEVVAMEEVTWPDGSVGCPQPGMSYTQALVNGSRIVLRVAGLDYQYNSGGGREPFYCANPSEPVPGGGDYGDI